MQDDNIVWYLTDGYWEDNGFARHAFNVQPGGTLTVNITALTAEGQQLARWALESWTLVTGIQFQEVSHSNANILFDDSNDYDSGAFSRPLYGNENRDGSWTITQALVNVSTNWLITEGSDITDYGFTTYIHEIGHALGLGHPGDYNAGTGTEPIAFEDATYADDVWLGTVMSYFPQDQNPHFSALADRGYPVTPMIYDLMAVYELYGTPDNILEGDTVYGYGSNTGTYLDDVFMAWTGEGNTSYYRDIPEITVTILDTGGEDWLDFRTDRHDQYIDLGQGDTGWALSSIYGKKGNLVIVDLPDEGLVIENVIAGTGNDTIYGNEVDNFLFGNDGNDGLIGEEGNDTLIGASGSDWLVGGEGKDIFVFAPEGLSDWDIILDFTRGEDKIDLSYFDTIDSVHDIRWYSYGFGSIYGARLDLTEHGGGQILLAEYDEDYIYPADFIFADDSVIA